MKRLAVLSIVLLALTTLVFAEVKVAPVVTFSGSGTLTWGIDLDTTANHGFKNEFASALAVTFVAASTETKGSDKDGKVYGYIALKDMGLIITSANTAAFVSAITTANTTAVDLDGSATDTTLAVDPYATGAVTTATGVTKVITAPTVEAYVVLGPAKWFIYAAPDLKISYAAQLEDDADDNYWAEDDETDGVAPDFGTYGTGLSFVAGPATLVAKVVSAGDWTAAASYGAGLWATLVAGPATVNAAFSYAPLAAGGTIGFGAKAALTAGPAAVTVAFDGQSAASVFSYEVAGGVKLALPKLVTITADAAMSAAGATMVWGMDAEVGATLAAEMVPGLSFSALFGLWDITTALEWGAKVVGSYKVMMGEVNYIMPKVETYISDDSAAGSNLRVALIGSVEAKLIPNTLFTLTYKDKYLVAPTTTTAADRALTFATKVSY